MKTGLGDVLHQQQIRELISRLRQIEIADYGSRVWLAQDQSLQRLNMQLHISALMKNDQYILQQCVTQQKLKLLIYDLILTATWKEKVLPLVIEMVTPTQLNSMKLYLALYHQSVMCNILQTVMFYRTAIDQSGDYLIELIDYCYKKISKQVAACVKRRMQKRKQGNVQPPTPQQAKKKKIDKVLSRNPREQLKNQMEDIQFKIFIMSISMLRYVTDYIKHLQIGILHHLLVECNIYALLVPLVEERPWLRQDEKGQREIFEDGKWALVEKHNYGKLPKTEAQVWIAIYNLFMDPQCRKKYQINDQRKNTLLKLRKYMNEVLLDQIPTLSHMLRSLEELSIMNVPTHLSSNPFVVQQMPIIASQVCYQQDWKQIAKQHAQRLKQSMDQSERDHMLKLADLYSNNDVQGLTDGFKCAKCQKPAFKRCSKCKCIWYCSKECQVAHWPQIKDFCIKKAKQLKEAEEQRKGKQDIIIPKKPTIDQLD